MTEPGAKSPAMDVAVSTQLSQLSAMFDDALPAAECELLARRLASDPGLRRQWARYSLIGAALRGDPLCEPRGAVGRAALEGGGLAGRVQAALAGEPGLVAGEPAAGAAASAAATADGGRMAAPRRWQRPVVAAGIAASVAALSLISLQRETPESRAMVATPADEAPTEIIAPQDSALTAATGPAEVVLAPAAGSEPESYVVPALPAASMRPVASAQLANFVVAHSEFSGSLARRSVLSALVSGEDAPDASVIDTPPEDGVRSPLTGATR